MARRLGLPARTWYNYENGVTVPAEILLAFLELTQVGPSWLFRGEGSKYLRRTEMLTALSPAELIRLCLQRFHEERLVADVSPSFDGSFAKWLAVPFVPLSSLGQLDREATELAASQTLAVDPRWVSNPETTIATLVPDDAMTPILPEGSILAIDRSAVDPAELQGRLVAARNPNGQALIRRLDLAGSHLILQPVSVRRDYPLVPLPWNEHDPSPLIGLVVWSCSPREMNV